tara:strand:- start:6047 stop:9178 length:3132 start_codon:yes stop_codon:yes gene_type:complete
MPRYYDVTQSKFWKAADSTTRGFSGGLGTVTFPEPGTSDMVTEHAFNCMPNILSLGFTLDGGNTFLNHAADDQSGDCSKDKPSFLLFNDFITQKELPLAFDDDAMVAMYTQGSSSGGDILRLCGDPIDLLGKLGSSTSKNPFHSSGDGYLSIGNDSNYDILTGANQRDRAYQTTPGSGGDAYDSNRSTDYTMYVNNFQQKGVIQFQKDLAVSGGEENWIRRENAYASTHIMKVLELESGKASFIVSQPDVLYKNNMIEGQPLEAGVMGTGTDLFIIYQYGKPLDFDPAGAGTDGDSTGTCAVGTIERDGNTITFTRVTSHTSMSAEGGTKWLGHSCTSATNGTGGDLTDILAERNMPRCMISPYRRWIIIQMGINVLGSGVTEREAWDDYPERGYGSICAIKRPDTTHQPGIKASGTITCTSVAVGHNVAINGNTYTAENSGGGTPSGTSFFDQSGTNAATATSLATQITADVRTGPAGDVDAVASSNVCHVYNTAKGVTGNDTTLVSASATLVVSGATFAGGIDTAAGTGFALGPTFNESNYYINAATQAPYFARRGFDITEDTPYYKEIDFGFGAYDTEAGTGGQVTIFRPDFAKNEIDLTGILVGKGDYVEKYGKPLSFIVSASGGGTTEENALNIHSSQSETVTARPKLITEFWDAPPARPGLAVNPSQENPYNPEFLIATGDDDLWYGFLMINDSPIKSKYDNIVAYAPLNENLDKWVAGSSKDITITPKQIKCYNYADFIGTEFIKETTIGDIKGKLTYGTADGLYNGVAQWEYSDDTCEGLGGHSKMNGGYFKYGLYPGTTDAGYIPNTGTKYRTHFSAQGIFTFNSAMTTNNYSMIQHVNNSGAEPVWAIWYDGTNEKIKARVYWATSGYVELASTTEPILDNVTPVHVCLVCDTEILEGNVKLYINGVLEDQTGSILQTGTTNNWQYGSLVILTNTLSQALFCGKADAAIATTEWTGKMEEIIVHNIPIYPFPGDETDMTITKNFEEVSSNITGEPKTWNAKVFVSDYHNFRGDYAALSPNISWKKPSFNIDGT